MKDVFKITVLVCLVILFILNQFTLVQVTKNQVTFQRQVGDLMAIQELVLNSQSQIVQKYGSIEYVMKSQEKYKQLKEESKNDPHKLAITSIIESVYPNITNQYELRKSDST